MAKCLVSREGNTRIEAARLCFSGLGYVLLHVKLNIQYNSAVF